MWQKIRARARQTVPVWILLGLMMALWLGDEAASTNSALWVSVLSNVAFWVCFAGASVLMWQIMQDRR